MTLRDEVAQLIFIPFQGAPPNSRSREYRNFARLIRETKVGGLILTNASNGRVVRKAEPYALAAFLNRMQRMAGVPLLVGGDFERGASMRVEGTTVFPHAMAFGAAGDPAFSRFEGEVTAREARALGVHWVYYPVADVNNNPDNPIINIRSFGEDPQAVAAHVKAFIEGAHSDKRNLVLATAKHFPGHGDTSVDTHLNLATVIADRDRLEQLELAPFRAAIEAGVDSIMTAHIAVPALAPPDLPATLSPAILTDLLRHELGFTGLVVTDALEMGGIAKGYSVDRLSAVLDSVVWPRHLIQGGGEIIAAGRKESGSWHIGIKNPRRTDTIVGVIRSDSTGAVSTSGDYQKYFVDAKGRRLGHIFDPRTGWPVQHNLACAGEVGARQRIGREGISDAGGGAGRGDRNARLGRIGVVVRSAATGRQAAHRHAPGARGVGEDADR